MEPITTSLVTALSAGAVAAAKDSATDAVKAAYKALKEFVVKHVAGAKPAVEALESEASRAKPDSVESERSLGQSLQGLESTAEASALAKALIDAIEFSGATQALIQVERLRAAKNVILEDIEHSGPLLIAKEVTAEDGDFRVGGIRRPDGAKKKTE